MTLSKPRVRALRLLSAWVFCTPSQIGWAMTQDRRGRALKAQGAGRVGGSMAAQLIKAGLVENASHLRGGYAAYSITPAGRRALADAGPLES